VGLVNGRAEDLLFSRIPNPIPTIVYEIPGLTAAQSRQFAAGLKRAFPQAEAIDAAAADEPALQEKLKNPFVLFTLLDPQSKLLARMAQKLPLKIEDGNLKWDDFSGPAKELRVLFMAPNPYGSGFSMVFGGGSLALLNGGNSGDYSYEIANAAGTLRTGIYDEKLAPSRSAAKLTAEEWRADVAFLAKELPARHKNAYHHISRAEFERRVSELNAAIPKMTDVQIRAGIAQLVAAVGDGHTWAEFPSQRRFDAVFREFPEGLFVVRTAKDQADAMGARVISIDGTAAADIRKRLTPFIAEENEFSWQAYVTEMSNASAMEASGIIRSQESAEMTLEKNGKTFKVMLHSVPARGSRPEWAPMPVQTPLYLELRGNYWFEYLSGSKTLYINYNACTEMQSLPFKQFAEQVLEQALKQAPDKVVFDLRNNGGGNSEVWAPLLRAVKNTPALHPKGRTYVIVGPGTFSSGMLDALELKQEVHAIVAGEPTTERPNHYGEVRRLQLPNSHIGVSYATNYFPVLRDNPPSLLPELRTPLTAADFFAGRDPVMEAIEKAEQR
jgi:hypothetical protein